MPDFTTLMQEHQDLPEDKQKKAGQAIAGKMDKDVEEFLHKLLDMIADQKIDTTNPETFINKEVYDIMPQEWKGKTDLALLNIAAQINRIVDFYKSKETPNESPQLQTMIEGLWLMKQRIEEQYDVFKF